MAQKTILVPLDGSEYSERALGVGAALADRMHCALLLVVAAEGGPLHPEDYLAEHADRLRASGCKVDSRVTMGEPVGALADVVASLDDAVICMTTHGRGRLRWAALGSVAEALLQRLTCPFVLVGRNCDGDFLVRSSRALVCADDVATAAVLAPTVDEWASALGLTIDIATVVHPLDVLSAEREHEVLTELRAPFTATDRATMISNRFVAGALADHADAMPAALVAMRAHARSGMTRFALGSVTMSVVHLVSCPVLVVAKE